MLAFAGYYAKALNAQQELALQTQILTALPTLLTALATASILVVGGFRVMNGTLSIRMLVAYQSLTTSFLEPINSLVNFGSTLQDLPTSWTARSTASFPGTLALLKSSKAMNSNQALRTASTLLALFNILSKTLYTLLSFLTPV